MCLLDSALGIRKEALPGPAPRPGRHHGLSTSSWVLCVAGTSRELVTTSSLPPGYSPVPLPVCLKPEPNFFISESPTESGDPTHLLNTKRYIMWAPASVHAAPVLVLGGASQVKAPPSASIQVRQTRLLPPQPCSRRIWGDSDPSFPRRHFLSPWGPSQFAHIMILSFQQKPNTRDKKPVALPIYVHRFKITQRSSRSGAREHAE